MSFRILVVDDQEKTREDLKELFHEDGNYVDTACDGVETMQKIKSSHFDLVSLDMVMPGKNGLEVAKDIREINKDICIMLITDEELLKREGYDKDNIIGELIKIGKTFTPIYKDFFTSYGKKAFSPNMRTEILKKAHELIMSNVVINEKLIVNHGPDVSINESEKKVLCRLFYECEKITISPLTSGYSGAKVFRVSPEIKGHGQDEVIVKIDWAENIYKESRNVKMFVENWLGFYKVSHIKNVCYSGEMGGIIYTLIEGSLENLVSFMRYVQINPLKKIEKVLEELFLRTFKNWYNNKESRAFLIHVVLQEKIMNMDMLKGLVKKYFPDFKDNARVTINGISDKVINPIYAFKGLNINDHIHSYYSYIHGDLNASNILIDTHNNCYVIDFFFTDIGFILQDFVLMELDLKLFLLDNFPLEEICQYEKQLIKQDSYSKKIIFTENNKKIKKIYQTILIIRRIAGEITIPNNNIKHYYITLFYYNLLVLRWRPVNVIQAKRDFAVYSAMLIYEKFFK
ncbi:response regulator [Candidatus Desantisbacteria bacterium]|nr:response regulator [Candidatus Desantisbacteria bacterium]